MSDFLPLDGPPFLPIRPGAEVAPVLATPVRLLRQAVLEGVFPGASVAIGCRGEISFIQAGRQTYEENSPPVSADTIYDCASLTKVVATTALAMLLFDTSVLGLDDSIARYLPAFLDQEISESEADARRRVSVRHLLAHSSGLPAYEKFFLRGRQREHVLAEALALPLEAAPGTRTLYSDVGFILLGELLERAASCDSHVDGVLTRCPREIFSPLGMSDTFFNPPRELLPRIAPTEQDNAFRHRLVHGEVHDENAWVMGGVAGHAGLFSTAPDLANFCQMMLQEGMWKGSQIIKAETIREFTRSQSGSPAGPSANVAPRGVSRGLGWDKPSAPSSSGKYFSPAAYGHLGFTGTSIWIDPAKQLFVVLLTNRVHPTRDNEAIRAFRPIFHDAVVEALDLTS